MITSEYLDALCQTLTTLTTESSKSKGKMGQCLGWKYWAGAESTLAGVELCSMIKQGQMIGSEEMTVWEQFYSLAA